MPSDGVGTITNAPLFVIRLLPEQKAWRRFAHLPNEEHLPDARMLHVFRGQVGMDGLRHSRLYWI